MSIELAIKDLNKIMALGSSGVKIYNTGSIMVNVSNQDHAASIDLQYNSIGFVVSNKLDGSTIGMKYHKLTKTGFTKIKNILVNTYWPNK